MYRSALNAPDQNSEELVELSSRLVYSLLKAAVKMAARFDMSMDRMLQLAQLAYFEELRRGAPRDLGAVAKRLGLSLRSVSSLNRRFKKDFFKPETEIAPLRDLTRALLRGPQTLEALSAATEHEAEKLERGLRLLQENGWVHQDGEQYVMSAGLRSFMDDTMKRRIDGLNNQMEIIASSVWARFVDAEETAAGRSWAFAAEPKALKSMFEKLTRNIRLDAIDVEEQALQKDVFDRYGITIAVAPLPDEEGQ